MRNLNEYEKMTLGFLSKVAEIKLSIDDELVWEINPEMGSIRSLNCQLGCRISAFANCQYVDEDGVFVVVTLLLKSDGTFGELDFWKVNDQNIIKHPSAVQQFTNATKFNKSADL